VRFLRRTGAKDYKHYGYHRSALTVAAQEGYSEVTKALLESGEETTYEEEDYVNAFKEASGAGDLRAVRALEAHLSNIRASTPLSETVLEVAVAGGHVGVVRCLLKKGICRT